MFRGFHGLLTATIIMLFIVAMLFNIAPITYIVFGIAIVLSLLLQYDWFKKHALSEKTHVNLIVERVNATVCNVSKGIIFRCAL